VVFVPVINPGENPVVNEGDIILKAYVTGFNAAYSTCDVLREAYKSLEGEARITALKKSVTCEEEFLAKVDSAFPSVPTTG